MTLENLLLSYNEVSPEQNSTPSSNLSDYRPYNEVYSKFETPLNIYTNQAKQPTSTPTTSPNWYFANYSGKATPPKINTASTTSGVNATSNATANNYVTDKSTPLPTNLKDLIKYWMNLFARYGLSVQQQIALVANMMGECGLKPKGSVEKKELAGKGNTKAGWAHAGEGAVGFTFWDTKKKLIQLYNAHPNRNGPALSTNEAEYANPKSRHIADLDNEDLALLTYLYYKDILDNTKNSNFDDTVAHFYQLKAGIGYYKNVKNPYKRAYLTGKYYLKRHKELGYHNAAKVNTFLKSLNSAKSIAKQIGYQE